MMVLSCVAIIWTPIFVYLETFLLTTQKNVHGQVSYGVQGVEIDL